MNFSKKINLKLVLIGIVFMGLLILTNGVLMKYALEKSAESTYNTHYKEAEKILKEIGFEAIFEGYDENPAKWVDILADANSVKTDFFEAKSTAYAKASVLIDDL